jgi:Predicted membrane protein (DUF2157)
MRRSGRPDVAPGGAAPTVTLSGAAVVAMSGPLSGSDLDGLLGRWLAEGWIEAGQADRIRAGEAARAGATVPGQAGGPRRAPLAAEALGYLGGLLAIVAGIVAVDQLWPGIPTGAELAFAAAGTVALGAVAAMMRTGGEPASARLRSVLWLLSTVCLVAFLGVLAAQVWDLGPASTTLVAAGLATPYAAVAWWRTRAPLQHLAMFAGAVAVTGTGIASAVPGLDAWGPGLGIWMLSAGWGAAVHLGYLTPRNTGYLAAGVGLLAGAQLTMQEAAGHVLAVATVAGLLAAGVALRRPLVLALGALGVLQVVPQTASRYLPRSVAAPLAVLCVGLALVGVALWLARTRKTPRAR